LSSCIFVSEQGDVRPSLVRNWLPIKPYLYAVWRWSGAAYQNKKDGLAAPILLASV
jgi:hypothetical protein